ncbi:MAG: 50S ribosomal protein L31e [Promethearchaeota archaeon]|nr:MAG: 50S ribosomal protein L31e [Candidatus Lokiarchaeota archaeon]
MAKKGKEISLDELEDELADVEEFEEEEEEEEIQEIEEFSLDEISEEEEISDIFAEEAIEGFEEYEEEIVEEVVPEEEIIDERLYTVPLAKARTGPRNKWAKKSVKYLKKFMTQHFKPEYLVISQEVNEKIWERGIQKPPRKLKVRATKNIDGLVVVYLA